MSKQEQAVKALTKRLNHMMIRAEQEALEWLPDTVSDRDYTWTFKNTADGTVTEMVYGFRTKTVMVCGSPTVEQWEAAWNNYIFRLKRLSELKALGRYGYQLRMPRLALDHAIQKLRQFDLDFCKRNRI